MLAEIGGLDRAERLVRETLDKRIDQIEKLIQRTMKHTDEYILWLRPDSSEAGSSKKADDLRFGIRMTDRVKQALIADFGEELESFNDMRDEIFESEGDSE